MVSLLLDRLHLGLTAAALFAGCAVMIYGVVLAIQSSGVKPVIGPFMMEAMILIYTFLILSAIFLCIFENRIRHTGDITTLIQEMFVAASFTIMFTILEAAQLPGWLMCGIFIVTIIMPNYFVGRQMYNIVRKKV